MAQEDDCFFAAYQYLSHLHDEGETGVALCHGMVTNGKGERLCHAWVETTTAEDVCVIDPSQGRFAATTGARYYKLLNVGDVIRYEFKEALFESLKHRHYGPWHESFENAVY